MPDGRYQELSFSPDGRHVGIVRFATQNEADIWIGDTDRGGATRFTSSPGANTDVVWSPDGNRILFERPRGPRDFFMKPASGATLETPFYASTGLFKDFPVLVAGWQVAGDEANGSEDESGSLDSADGGRPHAEAVPADAVQ